jgi:hypothetical protein
MFHSSRCAPPWLPTSAASSSQRISRTLKPDWPNSSSNTKRARPLPVKEIARRISGKPDSVAKHCAVLHDTGIVLRGFGRLYRIAPPFLVPGEPVVDLGAMVLRLDRVDQG